MLLLHREQIEELEEQHRQSESSRIAQQEIQEEQIQEKRKQLDGMQTELDASRREVKEVGVRELVAVSNCNWICCTTEWKNIDIGCRKRESFKTEGIHMSKVGVQFSRGKYLPVLKFVKNIKKRLCKNVLFNVFLMIYHNSQYRSLKYKHILVWHHS